jgi:hypothetical protein
MLTVAGMLTLMACASARRDVPAVIPSPTPESRAELARVVAGALHGAPLTLADDALTSDSTLVIEPVRPRDAGGVPLNGRERGRPEHFRLVKNGSRCVLVHEGTGRRFTLAAATCAPKWPSSPGQQHPHGGGGHHGHDQRAGPALR